MTDALEQSIEHWNDNVAACVAGVVCDVNIAISACALCLKHRDGHLGSCGACPVAEQTGRVNCYGTPYGKADRALERWKEASNEPPTDVEPEASRRACLKACIDMRDFLKGLRP